jgi:hypothetical protein
MVGSWTAGAGVTSGPLLQSINKAGKIWRHGFTPKIIWAIVKANAKSYSRRLARLPITNQGSMSDSARISTHGTALKLSRSSFVNDLLKQNTKISSCFTVAFKALGIVRVDP